MTRKGKRAPRRSRPGNGTWRDDWNTPEKVLAPLRAAAPIALDPCWNPTAITRPAVAFRIPGGDQECPAGHAFGYGALVVCDGLAERWAPHFDDGIVFVNPPYSALGPWLGKCADEARAIQHHCGAIVALVPASVDQPAWHDVVRTTAFVAFWRGRITFERPDGLRTGSAQFAAALLVWGSLHHDVTRRVRRELERAGAWCTGALP